MALDTTRRNQYGRNWKSEWLRSGLALSCITMFLRWYFHGSPGTSFVSNRCIYVQLRMYVCMYCTRHGNVWLLNVCCVDWKLEKGAIVKCNGSWEYLIINRSCDWELQWWSQYRINMYSWIESYIYIGCSHCWSFQFFEFLCELEIEKEVGKKWMTLYL